MVSRIRPGGSRRASDVVRAQLRNVLPGRVYYALRAVWRSPATLRDRRSELARRRRRILRAVTQAGGWNVQAGPFRGMHYLRTSSWAGDVAAKLLGSYESELHAELDALLRRPYRRAVNIGCAEGYYAVGLALRLPDVQVFAVDTDPRAMYLCGRLADMNGVADRIELIGGVDASQLDELVSEHPTLVIVDCEGCEATLLDLAVAPALAGADLVVELHDFVDPTISGVIVDRFSRTHDVSIVDTSGREPAEFPVLARLDAGDQAEALDEHRPGPMQWAVLRARGVGGSGP